MDLCIWETDDQLGYYITGPRRSGKTTEMMRRFFLHYQNSNVFDQARPCRVAVAAPDFVRFCNKFANYLGEHVSPLPAIHLFDATRGNALLENIDAVLIDGATASAQFKLKKNDRMLIITVEDPVPPQQLQEERPSKAPELTPGTAPDPLPGPRSRL